MHGTKRFERWLKRFTIKKLAKRLGVTERTVYKWKTGETIPTPERMVQIVRLGRSSVTYGDIIHHYLDI